MSQILKTAAPSAAQKKKWWLGALPGVVLALIGFIGKPMIAGILDSGKKQGGVASKASSDLDILLVLLTVVGVLGIVLVVFEAWTAVMQSSTKIEVTEDGVQGVSCPIFAFFTRKFSLKLSEIEVVEAPKDIAMMIRAKGVLHVIHAEGSQEIVKLIKELKSR